MQDTRYAVRLLARHPGFAMTAIGSIAVGIAACTAIVSLVYTLLFRPLDVPRERYRVDLRIVQDKRRLRTNLRAGLSRSDGGRRRLRGVGGIYPAASLHGCG